MSLSSHSCAGLVVCVVLYGRNGADWKRIIVMFGCNICIVCILQGQMKSVLFSFTLKRNCFEITFFFNYTEKKPTRPCKHPINEAVIKFSSLRR